MDGAYASLDKPDISNLEPCAACVSIGHPDVPPVYLSHLLNDAQPEARPLLSGRISSLEHLRAFLLGDTWPIVFDVEPLLKAPNSDGHVCTTVFDCVRQ